MSVYYNECPSVRKYGTAAATGIKSMAENIGGTLAPFAYASALILGTSKGITVIALGFAVFLLLFLLLTTTKKEKE